MPQTYSDLSDLLRAKLQSAVKLLAEVHNRRMSDAAVMVWCKALAPYAEGSMLWRAMAAGTEEDKMPSLHRIKELMRGRPDAKAWTDLTPLTPAEKKRSDNAAMLSMLWLHYHHGWSLEQVGQETIGRVVSAQLGVAIVDMPKMLAAAKEAYPKEMVLQWMRDQAAAGN